MSRKLSVAEMLDAELKRDPDVSVADLHFLAGYIDESIKEMSLDRFQGEYLAGRSESPPRRRRSGGKRKAPTGNRSARKPGRTGSSAAGNRDGRKRSRGRAETTQRPAVASERAREVRAILHEFAQELAGATGPAQAVAVMARVDEYVARILEA